MPGMFGAVGSDARVREALKTAFADAWGKFECVEFGNGILGGHAFYPNSALHTAADRSFTFAVDGELALYNDATSNIIRGTPRLFQRKADHLALTEVCTGNVALADLKSGNWYLAAEWMGSFPLYYFHKDGQFVFCSRLRPLARAVGAQIDTNGVMQWLVRGYNLAGRTLYLGIRCLLAGQTLTYQPESDSLKINETSRLWVDCETNDLNDLTDARAAAETSWEAFRNAVEKTIHKCDKHALMMSAGWDSRLLLCALLKYLSKNRLCLYSHGDLRSFELRIVDSILRLLGLDGHLQPLCDDMFDLDRLKIAFNKTEIIRPGWIYAAELLKPQGVKCVFSGVNAAVLGGHFGPMTLMRGRKRLVYGATTLLGQPSYLKSDVEREFPTIRALLGFGELQKPSYVSDDFWNSALNLEETINADLHYTLQRFQKRGITNTSRFIEAFISEHRGAKQMNAQPLACRANLDIALPYANRALLQLATRIPLQVKFQNAMHRSILEEVAPHLLEFPCAATIIPANKPIFLQEAFRLVRRANDRLAKKVYFATGGKVASHHFGWPNYEFLRNGRTVGSLIDDLQVNVWDKGDLHRWLSARVRFDDRRDMVLSVQHILKIYHVDLMLRS